MRILYQNRRGFTLVEMLVVLLILTATATIAVRSLEGIQDQTRYEATQRGMQEIEDAVIGPANQRQADGTLMVTGFVADMGRLPLAVGTDPLTQMQELWANPRGLLSFSLRQATPTSDTSVAVPCGWRGSYLRLGVGETALHDGWGNAYDLLKADAGTDYANQPPNANDPIEILRSRGADGAIDTTPSSSNYNSDLYVFFNSTVSMPPLSVSDRYHANISGNVRVFDGTTSSYINPTSTVTITYFGPNPTDGSALEIPLASPATPASGTATSTASGGGVTLTITVDSANNTSYLISGTTIGTRILRAYIGTPTTASPYPGPTVTAASAPIRLALTAGLTTKDLLIH